MFVMQGNVCIVIFLVFASVSNEGGFAWLRDNNRFVIADISRDFKNPYVSVCCWNFSYCTLFIFVNKQLMACCFVTWYQMQFQVCETFIYAVHDTIIKCSKHASITSYVPHYTVGISRSFTWLLHNLCYLTHSNFFIVNHVAVC